MEVNKEVPWLRSVGCHSLLPVSGSDSKLISTGGLLVDDDSVVADDRECSLGNSLLMIFDARVRRLLRRRIN